MWTEALDQGYSSGQVTMPARTGCNSTTASNSSHQAWRKKPILPAMSLGIFTGVE